MRRRLTILAAAGLAAAGLAAPAFAAPADGVRAIVATACNAREGRRLAPADLAAALIAQGVGLALLDRVPRPLDRLRLVQAMDGPFAAAPFARFQGDMRRLRLELVEQLALGSPAGLRAVHPGGRPITRDENLAAGDDPRALFSTRSDVILTCAAASTTAIAAGAAAGASDPVPATQVRSRLAIRGSIEGLLLDAAARAGADSFLVGYERDRSRADGTTTRTVKWRADGAIGFRLDRTERHPLLLYGDYSRRRVRTRAAPRPAMPDAQGGDDIAVIELGLAGARFLGAIGGGSLVLEGRGGVAFDRRRRSQRLDGGLRLSPRTGFRIAGVCGVYRPEDVRIGPLAFGASCRPAFVVEGAHVLRTGRATFGAADDLLAAGAEFAYRVTPPFGAESGVTGGVTISYLPVVAGRAPDLSFVDAAIGYRWWVADGLGLDLKLTYHDGVERNALVDEHIVGLGFGVIF